VLLAYSHPLARVSKSLLGRIAQCIGLVGGIGSFCRFGIQIHAKIAPTNIGIEKTPRITLRYLGSLLKRWALRIAWIKMAPILPKAAEMPWHVLRNLVGNISAGIWRDRYVRQGY